ncbi:MAG: ADP-forming succinate--CoA ligase subunit beta [Gammaproteobacteria bacterium]|nr:ADP-forming succinate--CoA ligase subunit beta [Gammaproteobacteria bacterium]
MRLHEYQAKALLARRGLTVPPGLVAPTPAAVYAAAAALGGDEWVLKAQIHAGARGKAGGIRRVGRAALGGAIGDLLGRRLVTAQTGPLGQPVHHLLVERPVAAAGELYIACALDRGSGRRLILASATGGVDIESGAPPLSVAVDPLAGLQAYEGRALARRLGLTGRLIERFAKIAVTLAETATASDALLVEINPLMVSADDQLIVADAKIEIDDNALFRQAELSALRDPRQGDEKDEAAHAKGLQYIALDGDIGCLVNGAGLAMATMDLIALAGGKPANFLDVGGGTTAAKVAEALELVMDDARVKAVFVNIFGGIVRCDLIAEGLLQAAARLHRPLPIVVRLVGTRQDEGLALLAQSGLPIDVTADLAQAAGLAVRRAQEAA